MLAPPSLGDHCFLLHTLSKTPKKRFEAFTFIDSYFYQVAPGIWCVMIHKVYGSPNFGSILWGPGGRRGATGINMGLGASTTPRLETTGSDSWASLEVTTRLAW